MGATACAARGEFGVSPAWSLLRLRWPRAVPIAKACPRSSRAAPPLHSTSLDGLPPGQFQRLVKNLNDEAQSRRLPVISREQSSAYRVRGYLAATVAKNQTTISWVWDVFDQDEHRALRISGEETAKVRHKDAWAAVDDAMLQRIAQSSMEQLAAFLTSPAVAPGTAPSAEPQIALAGASDFSPEAAGIFRIFRPQADPVSTASAEPSGEDETGPVPLPRRRPAALVSSRETLTLAASRR